MPDVTKAVYPRGRLRPALKVKQQIGHRGDLASNQDDERQLTDSLGYKYQAGEEAECQLFYRVSLRSNDSYEEF